MRSLCVCMHAYVCACVCLKAAAASGWPYLVASFFKLQAFLLVKSRIAVVMEEDQGHRLRWAQFHANVPSQAETVVLSNSDADSSHVASQVQDCPCFKHEPQLGPPTPLTPPMLPAGYKFGSYDTLGLAHSPG